ncbi:MAG: alpha/beta hydrolase [Mailhella sp.]|nr:alpha/beta hydrolase [Mailhella sp.]
MNHTVTISLLAVSMLAISAFSASAVEQAGLRYFSQPAEVCGSSTPYGNNIQAGKYALSDDAKIYYETYGSGKPFVVLHGGGLGSTYEMGCFIDKLKEQFQVIAISTRGHGKSEIGHSPFSLKQRADDIHAVLADAKITEPVMVIGFSDGGYSGYALAAYYPQTVKKLVAIGAGEVLQTNKRFVFSLDEWKSFDAAFIEQQQSIMPEPDRWQEMLHMYEDMWNSAVISKELFSKVSCPVLVMGGEHDINSPMLTEIASYQQLPNAQLSIIPNAPHPCFLTNFEAAWAAIFPFIR